MKSSLFLKLLFLTLFYFLLSGCFKNDTRVEIVDANTLEKGSRKLANDNTLVVPTEEDNRETNTPPINFTERRRQSLFVTSYAENDLDIPLERDPNPETNNFNSCNFLQNHSSNPIANGEVQFSFVGSTTTKATSLPELNPIEKSFLNMRPAQGEDSLFRTLIYCGFSIRQENIPLTPGPITQGYNLGPGHAKVNYSEDNHIEVVNEINNHTNGYKICEICKIKTDPSLQLIESIQLFRSNPMVITKDCKLDKPRQKISCQFLGS